MKPLIILGIIYAVFAVLITIAFVHDVNTSKGAIPAVILVLCIPPAFFGLVAAYAMGVKNNNPGVLFLNRLFKWTALAVVVCTIFVSLIFFAWKWVLLASGIALFMWLLEECIASGVRKGLKG
jgi:hypothetical protein